MRLVSDSWSVVEDWLARKGPPADQIDAVLTVLTALADDSWSTRFRLYNDVTRRDQILIEAMPGLVVVARFFEDYPDLYQLIYIGIN